MTESRFGKRARVGTVVAGAAAGLLATMVAMPAAQAAPSAENTVAGMSDTVQKTAVQALMSTTGADAKGAIAHLNTQATSLTEGNKLADQLGDRAADFFLNPSTGKATVNVLDDAAAKTVRAAGLAAKVVKYSTAQLDSVKSKFDNRDSVSDTAWGLDPSTNQVVLTITGAAPKKAAAELTSFAKSFGDKVRIEHRANGFQKYILGGEAITTGGSRCSAGFNATRGGQNFVVTAGHCTEGLPAYDGIGPSVESNFPTDDYGLVQNDSGDAPGAVSLYDGSTQAISGAAAPTTGQQVCKSGSTTQVTCGSISALDQTVNYGGGDVVDGLVLTSVEAQPGDSGGALFDGSTAVGLTSGGDGVTDFFYQPVDEALSAYGLQLAP